jgi:Fic family protein
MTDSHTPGPEVATSLTLAELRDLQARFRQHILALNADAFQATAFDLLQVYPETQDISVLIDQVDDLKRCLDSFRPLDPAHLRNLETAFDIEYTFESNRIEGNTLTLRETQLVVEKGLTIAGKPLREHLEALNHHEAIAFIRDLVQDGTPITESLIKSIHALVLRAIDRDNAGRYRSVPVAIRGSRHQCPQPYIVPRLMEDYIAFYEANRSALHPVVLAAAMHERLVSIHPFIDGNGRTSRLVMNLVLLQHGFVIANISGDPQERLTYYQALEATRDEDGRDAFARFVLKTEKTALIHYLTMMAPDVEQGKGGYFLERIKGLLETGSRG